MADGTKEPEDLLAQIPPVEPPDQRAARHLVEQKTQWATFDSVQTIEKNLSDLTEQVVELTGQMKALASSSATLIDSQREMDKNVRETRGWLIGSFDVNGHPVQGVLQRVESLDRRVEQISGILDRGMTAIVEVVKAFGRWVGAVSVAVIAGVILALILYALHLPHPIGG